MNKYIFCLLCLLSFNSCSTDQDSPAFRISDQDAQIVNLEFTPDQNLSPFYYILKAEKMIINWGNDTHPIEYDNLSGIMDNLKPLQYTYTKAGTYSINIRTFRPQIFDFSKGINNKYLDNTLSKITLTNCTTLKEFYCKNQTLESIDLSGCNQLEVANFIGSQFLTINISNENVLNTFRIDSTAIRNFDCTYLTNVSELGIGSFNINKQNISNIDLLKRLKRFYVNGRLENDTLNLTLSDSIQFASIDNSNLSKFNFSGLKQMAYFSAHNNSTLNRIVLIDNIKLDSISLIKNPLLDATALNDIFAQLPVATTENSSRNVIVLSENGGDATCDRSIATSKGWVFK